MEKGALVSCPVIPSSRQGASHLFQFAKQPCPKKHCLGDASIRDPYVLRFDEPIGDTVEDFLFHSSSFAASRRVGPHVVCGVPFTIPLTVGLERSRRPASRARSR